VNTPDPEIVPTVADPPCVPFTDQLEETNACALLVALNCTVCPGKSTADDGVMTGT